MKKNLLRILTVIAWASTSIGHSAVIVTPSYNNTSQTFFAPSNSDLVNYNSSSLASYSVSAQSYGVAGNINDGVLGAASTTADTVITEGGSYTITFDLDTFSNVLGYQINTINLFSGWLEERIWQNFSLEISVVGSASYTSLGSFSVTPSINNPTNTGTNSLLVGLTDTSGILATNVDSIRFNMNTAFGSNGTAYREIDITGVAVVPEPSTYLLLGLSLAFFIFLKRFKIRT
jgi:hypothetical protein